MHRIATVPHRHTIDEGLMCTCPPPDSNLIDALSHDASDLKHPLSGYPRRFRTPSIIGESA